MSHTHAINRIRMNYSFQHTLPHSLTFMFKDDDWFWKVFLGALALVTIPLVVGYFFVIGYLVATIRRCRLNEPTLPDWNKLGALWAGGRSVATALAAYSLCASAALSAAAGRPSVLIVLFAIVLVHAFMGPFVIIRYLEAPSFASCFDLRSIALLMKAGGIRALKMTGSSFGIFVIVLCFGWMALIIGWPLFIFWGMLVSASFTASLAPQQSNREAAQ